MKLYLSYASSYSQRVLIALYDKAATVTPIVVNLHDPVARAEYGKINPFFKVPAFETDDGRILLEACVLIEHIDRIFPAARPLIPDDPERALEVRMLERVVDVYINGGRQILFDDTQRPPDQRNGSTVTKARALIDAACRLLDQRLAGGGWLAGNDFTVADCAAAPTLAYLRWVYPLERHAHLTEYTRRLEQRPSVARAFAEGRAPAQAMLSSLKYPLSQVLP